MKKEIKEYWRVSLEKGFVQSCMREYADLWTEFLNEKNIFRSGYLLALIMGTSTMQPKSLLEIEGDFAFSLPAGMSPTDENIALSLLKELRRNDLIAEGHRVSSIKLKWQSAKTTQQHDVLLPTVKNIDLYPPMLKTA